MTECAFHHSSSPESEKDHFLHQACEYSEKQYMNKTVQ